MPHRRGIISRRGNKTDIADFHTQSQEVREVVLNYQKICLMMNRMTWHSNYNGWIKREQPHLINPEQLR